MPNFTAFFSFGLAASAASKVVGPAAAAINAAAGAGATRSAGWSNASWTCLLRIERHGFSWMVVVVPRAMRCIGP